MSASRPGASRREWWKRAVVYQIYPRSFQDSDGDGIGDLRGIASRLDYLRELGIDALWLCPVYDSPNADNGYDIMDYKEIMPEFGSMADMDGLISGARERGIGIIMDLVANHSSDEHPWFRSSRLSRESPYRDYYFWRDGRDRGPPNNWRSYFGGSAWKYDGTTGQWYLHLFSEKQPDLNWGCRAMRDEIYGMMRWWLDRGIAGFRMDVINMIDKHPALPDGPAKGPEEYGDGERYFLNRTGVHRHLREMREQVFAGREAVAIGETPGVSPSVARKYVDPRRGELDMLFQFDRSLLGCGASKWGASPWKLSELKDIDRRWYEGLKGGGWNSVFLNNHDQSRMVSRYGDDGAHRVASATMLAAYVHTLPGTPFIYQGEEIGMTNAPFARIGDCRDIETLNWYAEGKLKGLDEGSMLAAIRRMGRDNARTPMQWDSGRNAGFSTGECWIGVNPNHETVNVAAAMADPGSVWHFYRRLIGLRREERLLVEGDFSIADDRDESIYSYSRSGGGEALLVILNFGSGAPLYRFPDAARRAKARLLVSNYDCPPAEEGLPEGMTLRPFEARVYKFKPPVAG